MLLLCIFSQNANAQKAKINIDSFIKRFEPIIDFYGCHGERLNAPYSDSLANELIAEGKLYSTELIKMLSDKSKTVNVHTILSNIWERKKINRRMSQLDIFTKDACDKYDVAYYFIYNGLISQVNLVKKDTIYDIEYIINDTEIEKTQKYWTENIRRNNFSDTGFATIDLFFDYYEHISDSLQKIDILKYPCLIKQENNSKSISLKELFLLINKDFNDTTFKNIWKKLGGDSIINFNSLSEEKQNLDNISSIDYKHDGFSFHFDEKNKLEIIYLHDNYLGETPKKIKFSDTSRKIKRKLGWIQMRNYKGQFAQLGYEYKHHHFAFFFMEDNELNSIGIFRE